MKKIIIFALLILCCVSCNEKPNAVFEECTIEPNKQLILYGISVNKVMNSAFSQIEKEFGVKTQVDHEVSIVFIRKQKDFMKKNNKTHIEDGVELRYGPIEDLSIKKYKEATPNLLIITGSLNKNENISVKKLIVKELEQNLPRTATAQRIIELINNNLITGENRNMRVTINFNMHDYPTATFFIGFSPYHTDELFYKYVFSKIKDPIY